MSSAPVLLPRPSRRFTVAYLLRCLYAISSSEFKLKYAGSALGYVWALVKPLSYFGVLWLVFGYFFKGIVAPVEHFPLYLLIGIVLYTFFVEAIGATLPSLVVRAEMLRKLSFPRIVVPASATLTACMTFVVNAVAVVVFVAVSGITPRVEWLAIVPLLVELVAFTLGLGLLVATLFVRFRDISALWELIAQLMIFATPVMYPLSVLPDWARRIELANPLGQVMQDIRLVIVGLDSSETAASAFAGYGGRLVPIAVAGLTLVAGVLLFRRESPRLPERV